MNEEQQQFHYMYVLVCADETLYTGYTTDVEGRIAKHNTGKGAKYTACRRPVRLLAAARFATKHEAMSAEYHFKRLSRGEKLELVKRASEKPFDEILTERFSLVGERRAHHVEELEGETMTMF